MIMRTAIRRFCSIALTRRTATAGLVSPTVAVGTFRQLPSLSDCSNGCWFSSSAVQSAPSSTAPKLASTLQSELQYEKSNYEPAANITTFLEKSGWELKEKDGDINMTLKKRIGNLTASVEFQLVSPTYNGEGGEEEEGGQVEPQETTDFSVTVEKPSGSGAIFYCTTVGNDEKYRFIVGNVRYFADGEEKNSVSGYNGPEFEDLDDNLQSGIDEWLSGLGINDELCDFIDALAVDKEQREYMRWLGKIAEVVQ